MIHVTRRNFLAGTAAGAALLLTVNLPAAEQTGTSIVWDKSTLTLIQEHAGYGRIIRLHDGDLLCGFSVRGTIFVRKSLDNGRSWEATVRVADFAHGQATNAELLQLADGSVLLSYNARPTDDKHAYAICACSSRDAGATWSEHRTLYQAGTTRRTGCWEPAAIQLPSGEIQLFFANEHPHPESNEQEITLIRSQDNGRSWSRGETVSFRTGCRDGMPVPLILADGLGIAVAIEDNGLHGRFKPAIVHTSLDESWRHGAAAGDSLRRWGALAEPLPEEIYAGAPYIRQLPSGETILSVQSGEGRPKQGVHDRTQMVVYVGDRHARNFTNRSVPFDVPRDSSGLWNSLFVKDASTVTAVSGTRIDGVRGLWAINGKVIRDVE